MSCQSVVESAAFLWLGLSHRRKEPVNKYRVDWLASWWGQWQRVWETTVGRSGSWMNARPVLVSASINLILSLVSHTRSSSWSAMHLLMFSDSGYWNSRWSMKACLRIRWAHTPTETFRLWHTYLTRTITYIWSLTSLSSKSWTLKSVTAGHIAATAGHIAASRHTSCNAHVLSPLSCRPGGCRRCEGNYMGCRDLLSCHFIDLH